MENAKIEKNEFARQNMEGLKFESDFETLCPSTPKIFKKGKKKTLNCLLLPFLDSL